MLPLFAHSPTEAYLYLKVTPCPECSKGPWEILAEPEGDASSRTLLAQCRNCQARQEFTFRCDPASQSSPLDGLPVEQINPTDEPSRIIDLGQWLSLFHHFLESADRAVEKAAARRLGFQAAQCLDEVLKFYADDELPPRGAFFTEASRQVFAEHPDKFARQRLRDMRSRLPDLRVMAQHVAHDRLATASAAKHWWQFWK